VSDAPDPNLAREQRYSSALQQLIGYRLVTWEADRAVIAYEIAKDHLNRTTACTAASSRRCTTPPQATAASIARTPASGAPP
jgi:hypothetical protein